MKNKKGFTLVELLVVIIILGIILTIGYSAVSSSIIESRKKTNELALASIKESAEVLAQEIYICDKASDILSVLRSDLGLTSINNCVDAKNALMSGISVPLDFLKTNEYIIKADNCDGDFIIRFDCINGSGKDCKKMTNLKVFMEGITCR
ncbi:MAG: prepilin-type N-terminal cleavage/methylation domain-containing protein [Bacilli bacterium]|nr:prepilin-type N-terminal cleavage/methylation domain-containing protein [Bacilli bacterium]